MGNTTQRLWIIVFELAITTQEKDLQNIIEKLPRKVKLIGQLPPKS